MAADQGFCTACGVALPTAAKFCASCGSPRPQPESDGNAQPNPGQGSFSAGLMAGLAGRPVADRSTTSQPGASESTQLKGGTKRSTGSRWAGVWVVAAVAAVGMFSLGMLDEPLRRLLSNLPGKLNLAVEITKTPDLGADTRFGYVTVTNLGEALTLKSVSVNHRKDGACFYGEGGTPIDESRLEQGHSTRMGTLGLLIGACGSILVVSVVTDRGAADYDIRWR